MNNPPQFRGGKNVALQVPPLQFESTIQSYRQLGIPILSDSPDNVIFAFGPMTLHITRNCRLSQAEVWFELISDDLLTASPAATVAGMSRCDDIEPLPEGFPGFWLTNPAGIVHLVTSLE